MSNKTTFLSFAQNKKIEIPIFQRDYAQGRNDHMTDKIRKDFVSSLIEALDKNTPIELDFIYGREVDNTITLIDGQQRLTTLFLLHWYISQRIGKIDAFKNIKFSYATRDYAKDFTAKLTTEEDFKIDFTQAISTELKDKNWFYDDWKHDPTVSGMLNTLDEIHKQLRGKTIEHYWSLLEQGIITFYWLDLEEHQLTDELYLKMNARGKQLSNFENFKASLVKHITDNGWEKNTPEKDSFSFKMDTIYTDLFWEYRGEVNVIDYNFKTEEFHIKYPYDRVVKFDLPKLRQRKYDHNQLFKNIKNNLENLTILQKESISCYIEFGDNAFKIKMDLLSKEFLTIIKTIITDSLNFTEHILLDNYIDVNKLIDNVVIYGKKMKFTFKDLFYFRMAILGLANYYYLGEELFFAQKQKHSITSAINIDKKELNTIIKAICFYCFDKVIVSDVIDEIIDFYTFGSYEVKDIFCCPLIKIRDTYTISPSLIMSTNFGRVFIEHINKLEIDFKQGDIFEDNLKLMLEKHDFKVYNPRKAQLNFTTAEGHIGDIDILAIKGKYIFCAQLKNKSMPLEKREYVNYDRKLNKVLKQLKYVEEYFEQNPQKVLEFYEIEDLSKYKIIKFYVSNSFYRSGECIENIYITDMSALNVLFDYGKITIRDGEKDIIKYLRKNDKVSPEELVDFLKNPYFIWKGVYL